MEDNNLQHREIPAWWPTVLAGDGNTQLAHSVLLEGCLEHGMENAATFRCELTGEELPFSRHGVITIATWLDADGGDPLGHRMLFDAALIRHSSLPELMLLLGKRLHAACCSAAGHAAALVDGLRQYEARDRAPDENGEVPDPDDEDDDDRPGREQASLWDIPYARRWFDMLEDELGVITQAMALLSGPAVLMRHAEVRYPTMAADVEDLKDMLEGRADEQQRRPSQP